MTLDEQNQKELMRTDLQRSLKRAPIDPGKLTSFQRILLTTDGTVTDMLEAYFWERMNVVRLFQDLYQIDREFAELELELEPGASVLERRILLQGKVSHRNRIYAQSFIVPDRLDEKVRDGLLNSHKPIGLLLLEDRLETFREILSVGKEAAGDLADHFAIAPDDYLIYRVYRIIARRLPIMLITEKFPENEVD
ncbi:MAG TPA: chorismate pyruvate-lyase family protein [Geminicoccaceae bacterium]|nr:chorismate pyruvate-lyase family protein [Geminicoccaceae bacterium]